MLLPLTIRMWGQNDRVIEVNVRKLFPSLLGL